MMRLIKSAGWTIPTVLLVVFVLESLALSADLLGPARLITYVAAFVGLVLGIRALVRQSRHMRRPTLLLISWIWQLISLGLIVITLFLGGLRNLYPGVPEVPDWFTLGLTGSACLSVFVVGFVLDYAGKRELLSEEVSPGPLGFLFRRREPRD